MFSATCVLHDRYLEHSTYLYILHQLSTPDNSVGNFVNGERINVICDDCDPVLESLGNLEINLRNNK